MLKVLHVAPHFYPAVGYGGPVSVLYDLCLALSQKEAVDVRVLTSDTAGKGKHNRLPLAESTKQFNPQFTVLYHQKTARKEGSWPLLISLKKEIAQADVVHLAYAYSYTTIPTLLLCRLLKKRLIWSPYGAFQEWAGTRRRFLKSIWNGICRMVIDKTRTVAQVTSQTERQSVQQKIPKLIAEFIPHGVSIPDSVQERGFCNRHLLFMGRLDPIKGIENLLQAMLLLDSSITLDIVGSGEAEYVATLQKHAQEQELQSRIHFHGLVDEDQKALFFQHADLCIVPSHTESFGMVVAEALSYGTPVIASHGTPWSDLAEKQCGLWVDNSPESLAEAIRTLQTADLQAMGARGRQWMIESFSWPTVADKMLTLYTQNACAV